MLALTSTRQDTRPGTRMLALVLLAGIVAYDVVAMAEAAWHPDGSNTEPGGDPVTCQVTAHITSQSKWRNIWIRDVFCTAGAGAKTFSNQNINMFESHFICF